MDAKSTNNKGQPFFGWPFLLVDLVLNLNSYGLDKFVWNKVIRYFPVALPLGHHIKRDVQN